MNKRMLVVDDEELIVEFFKDAFRSNELEVIGANNGEDALQYVNTHSVDLVITDISMPKMQGTDLFFELKKADPFIQVIIVTGYPSLKSIVQMLEGGASDFIIKPFDIDQIRGIISDTFARIDRWRSLRKEWLEHKKRT